MGLYDYLGSNQVKCFPIAVAKYCRPWNSLKEDKKFEVYELNGDLRSFPRGTIVPYKTLYYNYGKDFIVLDYFQYDKDDVYKVNIVQNGRFKRSVDFRNFPSRYNIGLVLDKHGSVLNVKTPGDIKEIVYSHKYYSDAYAEASKENNINSYLERVRTENLSEKEALDYLDSVKARIEKVRQETLDIFNQMWYAENEEQDKVINGGWPLGGLISSMLFFNYDDIKIRECIEGFMTLVNEQNKNIDVIFKDYVEWCKMSDISIEISELYELFERKNMCVLNEKFRNKIILGE